MAEEKQFKLPPDTAIGAIELYVSDLPKMKHFYSSIVGLQVLGESAGKAKLGWEGRAIIRLTEKKNLALAPHNSAGLFHFAILFESKAGLARNLEVFLEKEAGAYSGSADHLVSEAFYGTDPEGNGFEMYADRDRSLWKYDGNTVLVATMFLDPKDYILSNKLGKGGDGQRMGHIHLKVGDLNLAREFYKEALGFTVTNDQLPGALFVAAGSYHHHLGLNVWASQNAGVRAESLGLANFRLYLPSLSYLTELKENLVTKGIQFDDLEGSAIIADPWGNVIQIFAAGY